MDNSSILGPIRSFCRERRSDSFQVGNQAKKLPARLILKGHLPTEGRKYEEICTKPPNKRPTQISLPKKMNLGFAVLGGCDSRSFAGKCKLWLGKGKLPLFGLFPLAEGLDLADRDRSVDARLPDPKKILARTLINVGEIRMGIQYRPVELVSQQKDELAGSVHPDDRCHPALCI